MYYFIITMYINRNNNKKNKRAKSLSSVIWPNINRIGEKLSVVFLPLKTNSQPTFPFPFPFPFQIATKNKETDKQLSHEKPCLHHMNQTSHFSHLTLILKKR